MFGIYILKFADECQIIFLKIKKIYFLNKTLINNDLIDEFVCIYAFHFNIIITVILDHVSKQCN